jgi:hypothetical protein
MVTYRATRKVFGKESACSYTVSRSFLSFVAKVHLAQVGFHIGRRTYRGKFRLEDSYY